MSECISQSISQSIKHVHPSLLIGDVAYPTTVDRGRGTVYAEAGEASHCSCSAPADRTVTVAWR